MKKGACLTIVLHMDSTEARVEILNPHGLDVPEWLKEQLQEKLREALRPPQQADS